MIKQDPALVHNQWHHAKQKCNSMKSNNQIKSKHKSTKHKLKQQNSQRWQSKRMNLVWTTEKESGLNQECTTYGSKKEFQILYFFSGTSNSTTLVNIFDKIIKISIAFWIPYLNNIFHRINFKLTKIINYSLKIPHPNAL